MTVTHGYSTRAPHYVSLLLLFDVCLFVPVCGSCSAAANNEVSEYLNSNNLQLFGPFLYVFWEIVHERRGDIRQLSWFNVCLFSQRDMTQASKSDFLFF